MWIIYLFPLQELVQQVLDSGPDGLVHEIQGGGLLVLLLWIIRQLIKEQRLKKLNPSHEQLRDAIENMATKEGLEYVNHEVRELRVDVHGLRDDMGKLTTRVSVTESKEK